MLWPSSDVAVLVSVLGVLGVLGAGGGRTVVAPGCWGVYSYMERLQVGLRVDWTPAELLVAFGGACLRLL